MDRKEIISQYLNDLMSIKSRLKICSYLLQKGCSIDKEELDYLLEQYKLLNDKINKLMSERK